MADVVVPIGPPPPRAWETNPGMSYESEATAVRDTGLEGGISIRAPRRNGDGQGSIPFHIGTVFKRNLQPGAWMYEGEWTQDIPADVERATVNPRNGPNNVSVDYPYFELNGLQATANNIDDSQAICPMVQYRERHLVNRKSTEYEILANQLSGHKRLRNSKKYGEYDPSLNHIGTMEYQVRERPTHKINNATTALIRTEGPFGMRAPDPELAQTYMSTNQTQGHTTWRRAAEIYSHGWNQRRNPAIRRRTVDPYMEELESQVPMHRDYIFNDTELVPDGNNPRSYWTGHQNTMTAALPWLQYDATDFD